MATGKRLAMTSNIRLKPYPVIADAVEGACEGGLNDAYKYTDNPTREHIAECVSRSILNVLCELIDFGD